MHRLSKRFRVYLEKRDIVERNVIRLDRLVNAWLDWLPLPIEETKYKHLMDYIGHLKEQGKSLHHINRSLQSISHYYEFMELPNVAITTRVKGMIEKAKVSMLTSKQMDKIYEVFEANQNTYIYHYSDKLVLGLIIYQGLEIGDFMCLELEDVDLEKGTIYIPSRGMRLSRTLKLESHQILQFYKFIYEVRPQLNKIDSCKLLAPQGEDYNQLHWQYKLLSKRVKTESKKKLEIEVVKLSQFRQSRVTLWIKQYGLRRTQYMGGYRTILSVERYRDPNMENLKEAVRKYHPW